MGGPIDLWLETQRLRHLAPRTIDRRASSLRSLERWACPVPVLEVTGDLIQEWLAAQRSPWSRHAYRSDVRLFYRWAHRRRLVAVNPTDDVELGRAPQSLPRPLKADDLRLVAVAQVPEPMRLVLDLMLFTGMRVGEVAALGWDDVRPRRDRRALGQGGEGPGDPPASHAR